MNLSVIVPVFNEEERLPGFLRSITDLPVSEIVIVDGGSRDQTPKILQSWVNSKQAPKAHPLPAPADAKDKIRCYFITVRAGRGNQMNAGAKMATGDIFLFLHADSTFPSPVSQSLHKIFVALQDPHVVGGAFQLAIEGASFFLKLVAKGANIRSSVLGLPYGDQGIFVRKNVFMEMGGYRDWPLMEDVNFVQRLKKRGKRVLLDAVLTTSARRWENQKVTRSLRNLILLTLYFAGVSPTRLARGYDGYQR